MVEVLPILGGIVGAAAKLGEYVVGPIKRQWSYMFCLSSNINSLELTTNDLDARRAGIQNSVDAARRNLEVITPEVDNWLGKVDEIKTKIDGISEEKSKAEQGCFLRWCPNIKARYSVSRKAKKTTKVVIELLEKGNFVNIATPPPPVGIKAIPKVDSEVLESRTEKKLEILDALGKDNVQVIGICGLGGVGKSTMVNGIAREAKELNLFDEVVMVVISQQPVITMIQQAIAEPLGLKLEEKDESVRAARIRDRLMSVNEVLVILDDAWKAINLAQIGIPTGEESKGCKIILVSRDRKVCDDMKAGMIFTIEPLLREEAWDLFQRTAGSRVNDPQLYSIAKDVVKECGCLPLALVTVAGAAVH